MSGIGKRVHDSVMRRRDGGGGGGESESELGSAFTCGDNSFSKEREFGGGCVEKAGDDENAAEPDLVERLGSGGFGFGGGTSSAPSLTRISCSVSNFRLLSGGRSGVIRRGDNDCCSSRLNEISFNGGGDECLANWGLYGCVRFWVDDAVFRGSGG